MEKYYANDYAAKYTSSSSSLLIIIYSQNQLQIPFYARCVRVSMSIKCKRKIKMNKLPKRQADLVHFSSIYCSLFSHRNWNWIFIYFSLLFDHDKNHCDLSLIYLKMKNRLINHEWTQSSMDQTMRNEIKSFKAKQQTKKSVKRFSMFDCQIELNLTDWNQSFDVFCFHLSFHFKCVKWKLINKWKI